MKRPAAVLYRNTQYLFLLRRNVFAYSFFLLIDFSRCCQHLILIRCCPLLLEGMVREDQIYSKRVVVDYYTLYTEVGSWLMMATDLVPGMAGQIGSPATMPVDASNEYSPYITNRPGARPNWKGWKRYATLKLSSSVLWNFSPNVFS